MSLIGHQEEVVVTGPSEPAHVVIDDHTGVVIEDGQMVSLIDDPHMMMVIEDDQLIEAQQYLRPSHSQSHLISHDTLHPHQRRTHYQTQVQPDAVQLRSGVTKKPAAPLQGASEDPKPLDDYVYDLFVKRSLQQVPITKGLAATQSPVLATQFARLTKSGKLVVAKNHQDEALGLAPYRIIHRSNRRVVLKRSEVDRVLNHYKQRCLEEGVSLGQAVELIRGRYCGISKNKIILAVTGKDLKKRQTKLDSPKTQGSTKCMTKPIADHIYNSVAIILSEQEIEGGKDAIPHYGDAMLYVKQRRKAGHCVKPLAAEFWPEGESDGVLPSGWRIFEPESRRIIPRETEVELILHHFYHIQGITVLNQFLKAIGERYVGLGMKARRYFEQYHQVKQTVFFPRRELYQTIEPKPMANVQIDVVDCEACFHGDKQYHYMLIVSCLYTKYSFVRSITELDKALVNRHLLDIFGSFGPPEAYRSEVNAEFVYGCVEQMAEYFGCDIGDVPPHIRVSPGLDRCAFQRACYEKSVEEFGSVDYWVEYVPGFLMLHNQQTLFLPENANDSQSEKLTPFEMMFGRRPANAPIDTGEDRQQSLNDGDDSTAAIEKQAAETRRKDPSKVIRYLPGDVVFIRNPQFDAKASYGKRGQPPSLARYFAGVVLETDDESFVRKYRVQLTDPNAEQLGFPEEVFVDAYDITGQTCELDKKRTLELPADASYFGRRPSYEGVWVRCRCDDPLCKQEVVAPSCKLAARCCRRLNAVCADHRLGDIQSDQTQFDGIIEPTLSDRRVSRLPTTAERSPIPSHPSPSKLPPLKPDGVEAKVKMKLKLFPNGKKIMVPEVEPLTPSQLKSHTSGSSETEGRSVSCQTYTSSLRIDHYELLRQECARLMQENQRLKRLLDKAGDTSYKKMPTGPVGGIVPSKLLQLGERIARIESQLFATTTGHSSSHPSNLLPRNRRILNRFASDAALYPTMSRLSKRKAVDFASGGFATVRPAPLTADKLSKMQKLQQNKKEFAEFLGGSSAQSAFTVSSASTSGRTSAAPLPVLYEPVLSAPNDDLLSPDDDLPPELVTEQHAGLDTSRQPVSVQPLMAASGRPRRVRVVRMTSPSKTVRM